MPSLSNYPPGVSGNEPEITGSQEEIYVKHDVCGEVFDDLWIAANHMLMSEGTDCLDDNNWSIVNEEEAF